MIEIMGYDACCPSDAILMSEGLKALQPTISIVGNFTVFRGFTPTTEFSLHFQRTFFCTLAYLSIAVIAHRIPY